MSRVIVSLSTSFLLLGADPSAKWIITPAGIQRWPDEVWLRQWTGPAVTVDGPAATANVKLADGTVESWGEDETGFWFSNQSGRQQVAPRAGARFPDFAGHPHAVRLRHLHHEVLTGVVATARSLTSWFTTNLGFGTPP